jgi:hypothetical protein
MKLPTLNIDVAVNTKTMQRGVAEAQKQINTIGKAGLALGGPMGGKFGQLGGLAGGLFGGGAGAATIGIGGIAMSVMAPFKLAAGILDEFNQSAERGKKALESFASGKGMTGGLALGTAATLAAGAEASAIRAQSSQGILDAFIAGMKNEQGQTIGFAGLIEDWASATAEGTKFLAATIGGVLAGKQAQDIVDFADQAISRSAGGAQAYMTPEQINALAIQSERDRKAQREANS